MAERAIAGDSVVDLHDQACPQRMDPAIGVLDRAFLASVEFQRGRLQQCPMPKIVIPTSGVVSP